MQPRVLTNDISGDGKPLILVPGGLTGWLSWIPHQERLSGHHRVVRVQPIHNQMGSAGEPGDPGYTPEIHRESLRLTMDELGIEIADFAGWSLGGNTLIEFTLAHPDRVRSLTLIEPGAYWMLEQLGETHAGVVEMNALLRRVAGRTVTEEDLVSLLTLAGLADNPANAANQPGWERAVAHRMALSWLAPFLHTPLTIADIVSIECPVLLVNGSETRPWEKRVVELLAKHLPNARSVELAGDHASHIQSIDEFLVELEAHLH